MLLWNFNFVGVRRLDTCQKSDGKREYVSGNLFCKEEGYWRINSTKKSGFSGEKHVENGMN